MSQESKKRVELFYLNAESWLNQNKESDSKFLYALRKMRKRLKNIYEDEISDKRDLLRLDYVSKDDKGNSIRDDKQNYSFTPEKEKEFKKKLADFNKEPLDIEPYFCKSEDIPKHLPFSYEEIFTGFVIKEEDDQVAEESKPADKPQV